MKRASLLCVALVSGGAVASASAQEFFSLASGLIPYAISDNGVVAGTSETQGGYFRWTASEGAVFIGGASPSIYGGQPSISNDGTRIGGTNINSTTALGEMAYYESAAGGWTNLGGIGGSSDGSTSSGWGISGDGQSMVGLGWVNAGTAHAIQWSAGTGTFDLGSTVANRSSRANAVSDDGSIVAGWQDDDFGFRQGAIWIDGVQTTISDDVGTPMGEALAISGDGQWVTGVLREDRTWRYNTVTDDFQYLDPVSGFSFLPNAIGASITDDGSTIVGTVHDLGPSLFGAGFIWRDEIGIMSMNDYFDSVGVEYEAGFNFSVPVGISGDGDTLAGLGLDANGFAVGWVVTVPSPSSAVLLGLGGLVTPRRRRYRDTRHVLAHL